VDVRGDVGCGAGLMVAASGEHGGEEQREEAETHSAVFYCRIGGILDEKNLGRGTVVFTGVGGKSVVQMVVF
jgi:hypothetical protein